jgi:hypothetical protein
MTNLQGSGTCNLSVNVPVDGRAVIGRAAFEVGARSVADFLRRILPAAMEAEADRIQSIDPHAAESLRTSAQELRIIWRNYYGAGCAVLCLAVLIVGVITGGIDAVRAPRRGRSRQEEVA